MNEVDGKTDKTYLANGALSPTRIMDFLRFGGCIPLHGDLEVVNGVSNLYWTCIATSEKISKASADEEKFRLSMAILTARW